MKVKIFIFILLIFSFSNFSFGQYYLEKLNEGKITDYNKFVQEVELYYKDKDKGRGSGYKQFKRWEYYQSHRLTQNGQIINNTKKAWDEYYKYTKLKSARTKSTTAATAAKAANWTSLGPTSYSIFGSGYNGGIGRVNCVYVDPANSNTIYVGTPGGGLWRSTDSGTSWEPLTDGMPHIGVSGVVIDPSSPTGNRTIYIITGDGDGGSVNSIGVMKSTDNGKSWYSTGLSWNINDNRRAYKILMHPMNYNTLFVAANNGVHKTENGALTWKNNQSANFCDIEFKPGTPATMYASTINGDIYRSTNSGNSWSKITRGLPTAFSRVQIAVSPDNSNYVYALFGGTTADHFTGLYRSTNSGLSFTQRSNSPNILGYSNSGNDSKSQSWYDLALVVNPTNAEDIHTGGINCWRSTNGGQTWTITSQWYEPNAGPGNYTHADIHALEFFGSTLYCGSDGGIFRSTDNADNWTDLSSGLAITQIYRIGMNRNNPNIILSGTQDNGSNRWNHTKQSFFHWFGADGMECIAHPNNLQTIYGSYQNGGILRSYNNGQNVTRISPPLAGTGNWITPFIMNPLDENILYAGYRDIWKTTNGGDNWINISNSATGSIRTTHISVSPSDTNTIYAVKSFRLYRTTDGGANWTDLTTNIISPAGQNITYCAVHSKNPDILWYTTSGFNAGNKVFRSNDGGNTWTNISGTLPNLPVNCIVFENGSPDRVYIGMDVGVYYLDNNTSDWVLYNYGLPNVEVFELEINYTNNRLYAGTYGRGLWSTKLAGTNPCPDLNLTGKQSGTRVFRGNTITSSSSIQANSNIKYLAKQEVRLTKGFHASSYTNTKFQGVKNDNACKEGIPATKSTRAKPVTGTYAGAMPGMVNRVIPEIVSENKNSEEVLQAYPNPFKGIGTIKFNIDSEQPIRLYILDVNGRIMNVLIENITYTEGVYEINFDGSELTGGVYYCVLQGTGFSKTLKLVVIQ